MATQKYGREWQPGTSELQMELTGYRYDFSVESGGLGRTQHFKNAYRLLFPEMVKYYFSWTEMLLEGWCEESKLGGGFLSVLGGSGCGKSYGTGFLAVLDWIAAPNDTITLAASTTIRDLNDRVWKTIRKGYTELPFDIGKYNKSKPECIISPNKEGGIYSIALKDDPDGERLKGFHPRRLRIIVDEATAFSPAILGLRENWTSAGKEFMLVCLSNFKGFDNLCAAVTEPSRGWHSIDYNSTNRWKTKIGGQAILFDMLKSPVYVKPELQKKLFFLKSKSHIDKVIYGDPETGSPGLGLEHPRVLQYIRSIPVFDDSAKTVLNHKIVESSNCRGSASWAGWGQEKLASLDPAFITGGDSCILQLATLGYETDGARVLEFGETISVPIDSTSKIPTEYQILDFVVRECDRRGIKPENFCMDNCGTGRGLGSIFQHEWSDKIMLIDPRGSPTDAIVDWDFMKTGREVYDRKVTELWWEVRRFIETSQIRGFPKAAIEQFCTRLYDDERAKMKLETKVDYKTRIHGSDSASGSPDEGDACSYILELAKQFGFVVTQRDAKYRGFVVSGSSELDKVQEAVQSWLKQREQAWLDGNADLEGAGVEEVLYDSVLGGGNSYSSDGFED
jgi:hypothetical protein